jgi:signal transduction histidine kinase/ActR/RegA family two-component response regulator
MLTLLPISVLYAVIPLQIDPVEVGQRGVTPIVLLGFLTVAFCYGLSRTSHYQWAARISVAHLMAVCYLEMFINPVQAVGLYRILIFAILLGAMMLSPRLVVLIAAGNLAVGTLRLFTLDETMQLDFIYAVLLLNAASVLLLVFIYHRNHLENLRRTSLSQRAAAHRLLAEEYAKANQQLQHVMSNLDTMFAALDLEARTAAHAVNEAREATLKALHQKTEFVSNISHEIRTPLTGVIGTFELLRETPLSHEQQEYIELGDDSAQKLLSLMNDLLDFSKLESGKVTLSQRPVDVRALCAEIKSLLLPQWSRAQLGFTVEIDPLIPQSVIGDPERLRQVLLNLAGNAIKFTHVGGVFMEVKLLKIEQDEALIQFSVSDTGIGIPSEQAEHIFESFVQGDASSSRRYGGTGLGLAIVRQLIRLMDSEIEISSQVGVGSTFTFSLRAKIAEVNQQQPPSPAPDAAQRQRRQEMSPSSDAQPNILIVEDNAINREMLTHIFANFGIQIAQVKDGESAVLAAQSHKFKLIMMDVNLPRMNGIDTTRLIRTLPDHANTPIIAMTAAIMSDEKDRYLANGMSDVLNKPFSVSQLHSILKRWLPDSVT